jgi:5,10-methylene-tetrahydrofolate dehydrogenase/methenyl tetrahydrofolate cyclohydrolase
VERAFIVLTNCMFVDISISHHVTCMSSGVTIEGKKAVVLGRSNIVGIPVSMLLMHRNATVTIVHSRTVDTAEVCTS